MTIFYKQPAEILPFGVDFIDILPTDDIITIIGSSIVVYDNEGNEVSDIVVPGTVVVAENTVLQCKIQAGVNRMKYKISFRGATLQGNLLEMDRFVKIKD